jgi:hypothetical protein
MHVAAEIEQASDLVNCPFEAWIPARSFKVSQALPKAEAREGVCGKAGVGGGYLVVRVEQQLVAEALDRLVDDSFPLHDGRAGEKFGNWRPTYAVMVVLCRTNGGLELG